MPPLKGEVVSGRLRRETGGVSARQVNLSVTAVYGGDSSPFRGAIFRFAR